MRLIGTYELEVQEKLIEITKKGFEIIVCLDGDGSILMHMGNLGILGNNENKNFIHIIFNNAAHESVGGQPTIYNSLDSKNLFKSISISIKCLN